MTTHRGWQAQIDENGRPVTDRGRAEQALFAVTRRELQVEPEDPTLGLWLVELPDEMALDAIDAGYAEWASGPFKVSIEVPAGDYSFIGLG